MADSLVYSTGLESYDVPKARINRVTHLNAVTDSDKIKKRVSVGSEATAPRMKR